MSKNVEIISLKWIEQGQVKILEGAKVIKVSQASANLNLKVNNGLQYPKYAPLSDVKKYMVEKPSAPVSFMDTPVPSFEPVIEPVEPIAPPTETKPKEKAKKPTFATVEEKIEWEKNNKA
jgi:hypothetical protein